MEAEWGWAMEEGFVEAVNASWGLLAVRLRDSASHVVLQVNGRKFVPSAGQWVHGNLLDPLGAYATAEDGHAVSVTVLRSNCTLEEALRLMQSPDVSGATDLLGSAPAGRA
jgi:hypothetical protein